MNHNHQPENKPLTAVTLLEQELRRVETNRRFRRTLSGTTFTLAVIAAIAVLLSVLWFPVLRIFGTSMAPVLREVEVVLTVKRDTVKPGKLVAFYHGNKILIKRCIATAGDWNLTLFTCTASGRERIVVRCSAFVAK